jgi:transcription initiation factor IIE alpha subunit
MTTKTTAKSAAQDAGKTKIATVIELLQRKNGADIDEIVNKTSWQKHTVRAALTGLRKKGHVVERTKVGGASRYSITKVAPRGSGK